MDSLTLLLQINFISHFYVYLYNLLIAHVNIVAEIISAKRIAVEMIVAEMIRGTGLPAVILKRVVRVWTLPYRHLYPRYTGI